MQYDAVGEVEFRFRLLVLEIDVVYYPASIPTVIRCRVGDAIQRRPPLEKTRTAQ